MHYALNRTNDGFMTFWPVFANRPCALCYIHIRALALHTRMIEGLQVLLALLPASRKQNYLLRRIPNATESYFDYSMFFHCLDFQQLTFILLGDLFKGKYNKRKTS